MIGITGGSAVPLPDWRDPVAYRALKRLDRAGLAWEWLRRDPTYADLHDKHVIAGTAARCDRVVSALPPRLTERWGLLFRRKSCVRGTLGAYPLERRSRSGRRCS